MTTLRDNSEVARARAIVAAYLRACAAAAANPQPLTLANYDAAARARDDAFLEALAVLARSAPGDERRGALRLLTRYTADWNDSRHH